MDLPCGGVLQAALPQRASQLRALDLFCGAGGASKGLQRAGFHVTGIDLKPQPRYCGDAFIQGDALHPPVDLRAFDFIWASPPCQAHTTLRHRHKSIDYPDHISAVRACLVGAGVAWVIENVVGAPLILPVMQCGSAFGLAVRRHRIFEASCPIRGIVCNHRSQPAPIDVSGTGARRLGKRLDGKGGNPRKPRNLTEAREAMGIDWMNRVEISQAIPPAYAEFIGRQAIASIRPRSLGQGRRLADAAGE